MSEIGNKTEVGLHIEKIALDGRLTYLEATLQWMEENNIEYGMLNKVVPRAIIDKIKKEAVDGNMLRPSLTKTHTSTFDLESFM